MQGHAITLISPEAPLQLRDGLTAHVNALQEEAAQQAEKDWATLEDAEKRIFENIAKGECMVPLITPRTPMPATQLTALEVQCKIYANHLCAKVLVRTAWQAQTPGLPARADLRLVENMQRVLLHAMEYKHAAKRVPSQLSKRSQHRAAAWRDLGEQQLGRG